MQVKTKSKKAIIKYSIRYIPITMTCFFIYYIFVASGCLWILHNILSIDLSLARIISNSFGFVFVLIFSGCYLNSVLNTLTSYVIDCDDRAILIKGKCGWKTIDTRIDIESLEAIFLGGYFFEMDTPTKGKVKYKNKYQSRLTFIKKDGELIKLNSVIYAFDLDSLCEFLVSVQTFGVISNVIHKTE